MVRVKPLEDEALKVLRICEPTLQPNDICVDVDYDFAEKNLF
jgi:hypothetical protein